MKLIDLLVQELPKLGGWPDGARSCAYGEAGAAVKLHFGTGVLGMQSHHRPSIFQRHGADAGCIWHSKEIELNQSPEDSVVIPREEYESALAASKQVEWGGEGLPPVGCDVEFVLDTKKYSVCGIIPKFTQTVNVVAHKVTSDGNPVAVVYWDDAGAGRAAAFIAQAFRPIRTEAERKRDEVIKELDKVYKAIPHSDAVAYGLYDAIAKGEIRGIMLKEGED